MSSTKQNAGSSTAKGKQPARDSDSDSFDEEIVVARPRGQIRQSILKPPNNSSESDGGVSISDGGVSISEANLFNFASEEETEEALAKMSTALERIEIAESAMPADEPEASAPGASSASEASKSAPSSSSKKLTAKSRQEKLQEIRPKKGRFLYDIGWVQIYETKGFGNPMYWATNPPNYGNARKQWISQQTESRIFFDSPSNQILIMECFDLADGNSSPMVKCAYENLAQARENHGIHSVGMFGPGMRSYDHAREPLTNLTARILLDGVDMDVKIPDTTLGSMTTSPALIKGFIMSHLRVSDVTVALTGMGIFEYDEESVSQWYELCKGLIGLVNTPLPGLKTIKLLLINPQESEAVNRIKVEFPDIPVLQVLTGSEFRQRFPNGQLPQPPREERKAAKKAAKKAVKKGQQS